MENDYLELTDEMIDRNDEMYNAVQECIQVLIEKEIDWDMQIIAESLDALITVLEKFDHKVRYPGIVMNEDGSEEYSEY